VTIEAFAQGYLLYLVLPLWVVVGFADYLCHRAARIEYSTGPAESILHIAMLAEAAVALLLGLFFEINALILVVMIAAFVAHEITSYWDLAYATPRRTVSATEQRVHDYLAVLPFLALSLVLVLHWRDALDLMAGAGDFSLRLKAAPLPWSYVAVLLGTVAVFDAIPFIEELARGLRSRRSPRA
jgi:hypothetical protein